MHKQLNNRKLKSNLLPLSVETEHLLSRLLHLREEEFENLSKQLHNGLGQDLACLKISAYRLYRSNDVTATPEIRKKIAEMITMIDLIMGSVREIAQEVRPRILETFGLIPAIESLLSDLKSKTSQDYRLINRTKKINIRIAYANEILKICKALLLKTTGATVKISGDDKMTTILVQNHGNENTGMNWIEENLTFLKGLQDRALGFGGRISITCDEKTGFSAMISIQVQS